MKTISTVNLVLYIFFIFFAGLGNAYSQSDQTISNSKDSDVSTTKENSSILTTIKNKVITLKKSPKKTGVTLQSGNSSNVFSWKDKKGVTHYSSYKPKSKEKVRTLPKTTISKYSSNKLIETSQKKAELYQLGNIKQK